MVAARKVKCASCGTPFAPQRSTAKYCKPACRHQARRDRAAAATTGAAKGTAKRPARAAKKTTARKPAARKTKAATPPPDTEAPAPAPATGLVETVRRDLEAANAVDTFNGQLALELARRVANPDEPSTSALSKELRAVMALAVGAVSTGNGEPPAGAAPPEDEVEKARRKREEARQAAGLS